MNSSKAEEGIPLGYVSNMCDYHYMNPNVVAIPTWLRDSSSQPAKRTRTLGLSGLENDAVPVTRPNLSSSALRYLHSIEISSPEGDAATSSLLWMHALAVGYAPAYLAANAAAVHRDWPRIPLPVSEVDLRVSAALGARIAALLDTERPVSGVTFGDVPSPLRLIAQPQGGRDITEGDA